MPLVDNNAPLVDSRCVIFRLVLNLMANGLLLRVLNKNTP